MVHTVMKTERLLCVQVDYAGVTRLLSSRRAGLNVASINGTEHVWDLLPRNLRW
jgi:probable phosphoglycerate mutase